MSKRKESIKRAFKYKKERVVLSDILPFEIPITFTNRHFYSFLVTDKIELRGSKLHWERNDPTLNNIVALLFDLDITLVHSNEFDLKKSTVKFTIPFKYKVAHKENDFRELTIIHPKGQLEIIQFYDDFKELILYYCGISAFSIRRAVKIANSTYYSDKTHSEKIAENPEEQGRGYENLRTFFVYKNFSNIHKFYESYKYHRCETKYSHLFKFDISKCFDSIYTHSLSWALTNKSIIKDNIDLSNATLGGRFDRIMQSINFNETNGIIIGPEFSRVFAELVLQKIDSNVEIALQNIGSNKLINKVHYEIFRYVDDYFVFYNEESTKEAILKEFRLQLKEYKLYLNDAKTVLYHKPIITAITIAKQDITELLNHHLDFWINESEPKVIEESRNFYTNSNKLITQFKTIITVTKVDYKDIINYTLAVVERKLSRAIKIYSYKRTQDTKDEVIIKFILELLDFTFFIYSVTPRVNTTIKLCRILRILTEFIASKDKINFDLRHPIYKKIYDNIFFTLQKNKSVHEAQVETLYLLIALRELGKEYWLNIDVLIQYFGIERNGRSLTYKGFLNYFAVIVLLFYLQNKKRYSELKLFLKGHIREIFLAVDKKDLGRRAELRFLLFDLLTCPYLDQDYKKEILYLHGITNEALKISIIHYRKYWFTKWMDFDFGKELDTKHSREVY